MAPALKPGMVVIFDNASFHKSKKIIQLIETFSCKLMFLPSYSPDFNPIEHHWTAVKQAIRADFENLADFYQASIQTLTNLCTA